MSPLRAILPAGALAALIAAVVVPACTNALGTGQGIVTGTLDAPNCWSGPFNLNPDFYAAVPYRDTVELRIQKGGDFETFSDGIVVLVDDLHKVRGDNGNPGELGQALKVGLPPGVAPPGVPITPDPDPAQVHLTLYLQKTCATQDVALHAAAEASLFPNGSCDGSPDAGPFVQTCGQAPPPPPPAIDAGADGSADGGTADAGPVANPIGRSTITFAHLYNGVIDETNAAQRLTEATFDVYLVDPREICPGGLGPPPRCRGHLTGNFLFYYERGRPGQPFP